MLDANIRINEFPRFRQASVSSTLRVAIFVHYAHVSVPHNNALFRTYVT